ncbi:hypothetical protein [Actinomadura sp. NBRC 104425]|uniref:hypothetical protein n=1 Tax=Actinomadura sp. NBRC 104425 TaxID=3032204 RepID=UPI0025578757|nr:hypothetical protein [Actinomadura sp. NBRC 104425]
MQKTKMALGLTIVTALGLGLAQPSTASTSTSTTAAAPAPAAAAPAARIAANCTGRLIHRWPLRLANTKIGELVLYRDRTRKTACARMNHVGPTRNVRLRTAVWLAACRERRGTTCTPAAGSPKADDGVYASYAGPVTVRAAGRCVHAAGDIYYQGAKRHIDSSPWLAYCS